MFKKALTFILLFSAIMANAGEIIAHNFERGYGNSVNKITISITRGQEDQYLNGKITFRGYDIQNYFSNELEHSELKKEITWLGGGGRSYYVYSIKAHVDLSNMTASRHTSDGKGFAVFPDFGGLKIIALTEGRDSGKDWWFRDTIYIDLMRKK